MQTKAVDELAAAGLRNAVRVEVKAVAVAAAATRHQAGASAGVGAAAANGSHGRGRRGEAALQGDDGGSGGDSGGGAGTSGQPSSLATPPGLSLEVRAEQSRGEQGTLRYDACGSQSEG